MRNAILHLRPPTVREIVARRAVGDAALRRLLSIPGGDALYADILAKLEQYRGERAVAIFRWLQELLDRSVARGDVIEAASILNLKGNLIKIYRFDAVAALRCHRQSLRAFRGELATIYAAEALGDIGAVLLEAGRWRKVARWWRASVREAEHATRQHDVDVRPGRTQRQLKSERQVLSSVYATHLADYAYIMALRNPMDRRNFARLDAALRLARTSGDAALIARALVNLANYLFFDHLSGSVKQTVERAYQYVSEAERLARQERADYLGLLVTYTRIAFRLRGGRGAYASDTRRFRASLPAFLPNVAPDGVGDVRLHNMAKHAIFNDVAMAKQLPSRWRTFVNAGASRERRFHLSRSEQHNPYFRSGVYVTYY